MVSIIDIRSGDDLSALLPELMAGLPTWRLEKALAYRFDLDRFLCAKSYLVLEDMLRKHFGIESCPPFSYGSHGKPYLREYPDIHFNISHCRKGIACAVSDCPVGVDIEEIQFDSQLADKVLNHRELEEVMAASGKRADAASFPNAALSPAEKFAEYWTKKESAVKLSGEGMTIPMKDILSKADGIRFETMIDRRAGYVCTAASYRD